jgi:hypothetical protein
MRKTPKKTLDIFTTVQAVSDDGVIVLLLGTEEVGARCVLDLQSAVRLMQDLDRLLAAAQASDPGAGWQYAIDPEPRRYEPLAARR